MLAYGYTFGDVMWSMLVFFAWILFFWMLWVVFSDVFWRHDIGGWAKAGWTVFVILVPIIGSLVYIVAEGKGMAQRKVRAASHARVRFDDHVRSAAGSTNSAEQITRGKELLDSGVLTQAEFEALKRKSLA
jgi:hypothetical protein